MFLCSKNKNGIQLFNDFFNRVDHMSFRMTVSCLIRCRLVTHSFAAGEEPGMKVVWLLNLCRKGFGEKIKVTLN